MKASFDLLFATRQLLLKTINGLSLDQINKVPVSYSNSIGWNVVHIMATQQILHYTLSGQETVLDQAYVDQYRKGTRFESPISAHDWDKLKKGLSELPKKFEGDYKEGKFSKYEVYQTSYGYKILTIEDAIKFNNLHEALHLGYIMSMKKLV